MTQWKAMLLGLVPALALALVATGAQAKVRVNPVCKADAAKYCKTQVDQAKGELTVFDCLLDRKTEISTKCRDYVGTQSACEMDVGKYCKGMIFGNTKTCLAKHKADLAQACKNRLGWTRPATGQSMAPAVASAGSACVCMNEKPPAAIQQECMNNY